MPVAINNPVAGMWALRNTTVVEFAKDQTGLIEYSFNSQGWRSMHDYDAPPTVAFFGCSLVFGVGVLHDQIFSSLIPGSHNYGLAGNYDNHSVFDTLTMFLKSPIYTPQTKIVVCWTDRDSEALGEFYQHLPTDNLWNFYCGEPLAHDNCRAMPARIDTDVTGTHMGPLSHKFFAKAICALLKLS